MRTKNTALPPARVDIDTRGEKTVATLWNGAYIETVNQDGLTEYEYDIYQIETRLRPSLADDINSKFDVWYEAAKSAEIIQPDITIEERMTIIEYKTDNIIDILAEALL